MTVTPIHPAPDLGPVRTLPNQADPEAVMVNVAGIVAIAAQQDTPQSKRFYAAFCRSWARWKTLPYSDNHKQGEALREALASIGSEMRLVPERPSG